MSVSFVSVCLFVCLFVCLSVCLYVCLFVCLYVCLFVCLFICLCVCLYVCMFVCLFVCLFISLSDCLSLQLYTFSTGSGRRRDSTAIVLGITIGEKVPASWRMSTLSRIQVIVIVILSSKLLKRHSIAKRRAPTYSRELRQIRGDVQRIVRGRLRPGCQRV